MFHYKDFENNKYIVYLSLNRYVFCLYSVVGAFYVVIFLATLKRGRQKYLLKLQTLVLVSVISQIWHCMLGDQLNFGSYKIEEYNKKFIGYGITGNMCDMSYFLATWFFVWRYVQVADDMRLQENFNKKSYHLHLQLINFVVQMLIVTNYTLNCFARCLGWNKISEAT